MQALNLNHLNSFSEVIHQGSFSAAAATLNLTQPAVSLHIRLLEQRLNLRLIERVGKRLKPTAAGLTLLSHIGRIDSVIDDALQDLASHTQGVAGQVVIGTGATACIHLLPPILKTLRTAFPKLDVRVCTGNTEAILKAVEENRIDLALVTLPAAGRSLHFTTLLEDEMVAIFAPDQTDLNPSINADALSSLPLVVFEAGSSTRLLINQWFQHAGVRPSPVMELGSIEAIKEMVSAGLGYSIVPRIAVATAHHQRNLQIRSLAPPLSRSLSLVLRQDKPVNRALREVVDALQGLDLNEPGAR